MLNIDFLKNTSAKAGFDLTQTQLKQIDTYAEMLVEWNKNVNLTAILDPDEMVVKHFVDSFLLLNHIEFRNSSLIDVGTGAGFPALPCKILQDELKITLLDSMSKRLKFLEAVCKKIGVKASILNGRAEEVALLPEHREKYDIATARAVAHMRELTEYCLPFVKVGGYFIALKGYEIEDELDESAKAIETLGGVVDSVTKYELEDGSKRAIVCIKKKYKTPDQYPRNKGRMTKKPL